MAKLSGYQKKQQRCAFWLFVLLVIALLTSLGFAASITFQWWEGLRDLTESARTLKNTAADLETDAAKWLEEAEDFETEATSLTEKVPTLQADEAESLMNDANDALMKAKDLKNKAESNTQQAEDKRIEAAGELAKLATFDYLAWMLAAWAGAAVYLIGQVATYYPKIKESAEEDDKADFKKYSYWYASTFLKAPVLALVVMWFLVNLKVELGTDNAANELGIAVDFSGFGPYIMIGVAFVLGFYGRVTRKQLDIIAKYLFTRAWALAEQGFELVVPSMKSILINDTYAFATNPPAEVVWSATLGTIDPEKGTYKAPTEISARNQEALIRASLRAEPASTDFARIMVKAIRIEGGKKEVEKGNPLALSVETKLEEIDLEAAKWLLNGEDTTKTGKTYTFQANEKGTFKISVTATHKAKQTQDDGTEKEVPTPVSDEIEIEVVKKKEREE